MRQTTCNIQVFNLVSGSKIVSCLCPGVAGAAAADSD